MDFLEFFDTKRITMRAGTLCIWNNLMPHRSCSNEYKTELGLKLFGLGE